LITDDKEVNVINYYLLVRRYIYLYFRFRSRNTWFNLFVCKSKRLHRWYDCGDSFLKYCDFIVFRGIPIFVYDFSIKPRI